MQKTRLLHFEQITSQAVSQPAHFEWHAQKGAGLQPQRKTALLHQMDQTDQSDLDQTDQTDSYISFFSAYKSLPSTQTTLRFHASTWGRLCLVDELLLQMQ